MGTKAKTKVCLNKVDLTRKQNETKQKKNGERGTPGKNDVHYFRWLKNSPRNSRISFCEQRFWRSAFQLKRVNIFIVLWDSNYCLIRVLSWFPKYSRDSIIFLCFSYIHAILLLMSVAIYWACSTIRCLQSIKSFIDGIRKQ